MTLKTTNDALLLFEACRLNLLKRVQRRLSEAERQQCIRSGAVFVWDEEESGIRRWTDGKAWSASRIHGSFLLYKEVQNKPKGRVRAGPHSLGVDPYILEGGLVKKALSICTGDNKRQHLVSYYSVEDLRDGRIRTPSEVSHLAGIAIPTEMYPEFVADAATGVIGGGHSAHGNFSSGRAGPQGGLATSHHRASVDYGMRADSFIQRSPVHLSNTSRSQSRHEHGLSLTPEAGEIGGQYQGPNRGPYDGGNGFYGGNGNTTPHSQQQYVEPPSPELGYNAPIVSEDGDSAVPSSSSGYDVLQNQNSSNYFSGQSSYRSNLDSSDYRRRSFSGPTQGYSGPPSGPPHGQYSQGYGSALANSHPMSGNTTPSGDHLPSSAPSYNHSQPNPSHGQNYTPMNTTAFATRNQYNMPPPESSIDAVGRAHLEDIHLRNIGASPYNSRVPNSISRLEMPSLRSIPSMSESIPASDSISGSYGSPLTRQHLPPPLAPSTPRPISTAGSSSMSLPSLSVALAGAGGRPNGVPDIQPTLDGRERTGISTVPPPTNGTMADTNARHNSSYHNYPSYDSGVSRSVLPSPAPTHGISSPFVPPQRPSSTGPQPGFPVLPPLSAALKQPTASIAAQSYPSPASVTASHQSDQGGRTWGQGGRSYGAAEQNHGGERREVGWGSA
ncbi:hypothetical protein HDU93_004383 [Gonapodya sp. JEL0774]|nr:hypothetical protein HDU93_004383 [Gonapodya sp. JEL0774]